MIRSGRAGRLSTCTAPRRALRCSAVVLEIFASTTWIQSGRMLRNLCPLPRQTLSSAGHGCPEVGKPAVCRGICAGGLRSVPTTPAAGSARRTGRQRTAPHRQRSDRRSAGSDRAPPGARESFSAPSSGKLRNWRPRCQSAVCTSFSMMSSLCPAAVIRSPYPHRTALDARWSVAAPVNVLLVLLEGFVVTTSRGGARHRPLLQARFHAQHSALGLRARFGPGALSRRARACSSRSVSPCRLRLRTSKGPLCSVRPVAMRARSASARPHPPRLGPRK